MTARVNGCRALAVSLGDGDVAHWSTAADFAAQALERLLTTDKVLVFNLNVPNTPRAEVRGVHDAELARFGAVQTGVVESGKGWLRLGIVDGREAPEPGSDAALLAEGYACVTPLRPLCAEVELDVIPG
jgi:5'-nucleotidase